LPPETFETGSTPRISNKVDIWAVGVIFFQMLYGRRPFAEGENQRRIWHDKLILQHARTLEFPPPPPGQRAISSDAKELIRKCLAFDAKDRIDVVQLSNEPYLRRKGAVLLMPPAAAAASSSSASSLAAMIPAVGGAPPPPLPPSPATTSLATAGLSAAGYSPAQPVFSPSLMMSGGARNAGPAGAGGPFAGLMMAPPH
jgi:serine/threonine protein kinase